jgi:hypothetical protein
VLLKLLGQWSLLERNAIFADCRQSSHNTSNTIEAIFPEHAHSFRNSINHCRSSRSAICAENHLSCRTRAFCKIGIVLLDKSNPYKQQFFINQSNQHRKYWIFSGEIAFLSAQNLFQDLNNALLIADQGISWKLK